MSFVAKVALFSGKTGRFSDGMALFRSYSSLNCIGRDEPTDSVRTGLQNAPASNALRLKKVLFLLENQKK